MRYLGDYVADEALYPSILDITTQNEKNGLCFSLNIHNSDSGLLGFTARSVRVHSQQYSCLLGVTVHIYQH